MEMTESLMVLSAFIAILSALLLVAGGIEVGIRHFRSRSVLGQRIHMRDWVAPHQRIR